MLNLLQIWLQKAYKLMWQWSGILITESIDYWITHTSIYRAYIIKLVIY